MLWVVEKGASVFGCRVLRIRALGSGVWGFGFGRVSGGLVITMGCSILRKEDQGPGFRV